MAGCPVTVRPSKGTMVAMAYRFVNTIINRCHAPGDGDILVPVGTVAVIGTTSVNVPDPNDTSIQAGRCAGCWKRARRWCPASARCAACAPGRGSDRCTRKAGAAQGRDAKRTFAVLDHAQRDGVSGLITVVGGKFTTYRLMAERAADVVCGQLGVTQALHNQGLCLARSRVPMMTPKTHWLGHRLESIETAKQPDSLICECELVTRSDFEQAARAHADIVAPWVLDDLRRDLRLGMGPCQGGFCGYRAAGILHETGHQDAAQATAALADFAQKRWKGQRPLLWGQSLRQALLDEQIYRGILGLDRLELAG